MAKRRYPSEINTRSIRVNIGTYQLLTELAAKSGLTIAEALDSLIIGQTMRAKPVIIRSQIPMPVLSSGATTAISINGDRHIAIGIKPKGGVIDGG